MIEKCVRCNERGSVLGWWSGRYMIGKVGGG